MRALLLLAAAVALAGAGPDPAECDPALARAAAIDPVLRAAGVAALRRLYGERTQELLPVAATDARAAVVLGLLGGGTPRSRLLKLLQDPDAVVRRAAAESLVRGGGSGGEAELLPLLGDYDDATALAGARALAAMGARAPKARLVALRDGGGTPREGVAAAYALEVLEPGYHGEYLRKGLRHEGTRSLAAAAGCNVVELVPRREKEVPKRLGVDPKALLEAAEEVDPGTRVALALLCMHLGVVHPAELATYLDRTPAGPGEAAASLLVEPIPLSASAAVKGLVEAVDRGSGPARDRLLDRAAAILRERCTLVVPAGPAEDRAAWIRTWWERTWRDQVDGEVDAAIARGVAWLETRQRAEGFWCFRSEDRADAANARGMTALGGYTLLKMGVPVESPAVERAAEFLLRPWGKTGPGTYAVSLEAMFFSELAARLGQAAEKRGGKEPPRGLLPRALARVQACAEWLVDARVIIDVGGYGQAAWGYGASAHKVVDRYDHSNTQYALLGLLAARAAGAGARVPVEVWRDAARHWEQTQCEDGGWDYIPKVLDRPAGGKEGTTAMTGAGIMGRLIGLAVAGGTETAALADSDPAVKRALDLWAEKRPVPAFGHIARGDDGVGPFYDLYALERAMMLAGKRTLGEWDWYREGALLLFLNQGLDGSWGAGEADSCFALLFLKKAYVPVATK